MAYVIILKGDPIRKEAVAGGTITPGMLLKRSSATQVIAHNVSGGNAMKLFALENGMIGDTITDNYVSGDQVQMAVFRPGDEAYLILKQGQNVAVGDPLESNGDGKLKKHTANTIDTTASVTETIYESAIVGYALEAVNASSADARIKVEIA